MKVWTIWQDNGTQELESLVDICATEAAAKRVLAEKGLGDCSIEEWDVTE